MILSMNSQDLLEGLNTVTRALSPRPAKQILEGVLISAEDNRVMMTCSFPSGITIFRAVVC